MQQLDLQIIIPVLILPILSLVWWRLRLKKLKEYYSPILGKIEVLQKYNREKVLTINLYPQGISIQDPSIKKSYWFCIANLTAGFCQRRKNPQVLMLGLGACTIPNLIAQKNHSIHQTIIEIDSMVISACRDFFGLDQLPNCQIIQADAYKLVGKKNAFTKNFDAIIIDIYLGRPPYVSLESHKPTFIQKLLPYLKKDGIILFNSPGNTSSAREESEQLKKYLKTLFKKTKKLDIKDPRRFRNNIIVASIKK